MSEPSPAAQHPPSSSHLRSERLGQDGISRLLWQFSLPAIVGMMTQALYNVIDSIFIGRAIGKSGIAAMFVAFPMMSILMAFSMLVGFGAGAIISIRLGEGKKAEAEDVLRHAAIMLGVGSLALTLAGFLALDPLLTLFGARENVIEYTREYMQIILGGAFFQIVGFGLNAAIRAEGNPRVAMMTLLIGVVLNTLLAPFLIFRSGWIMPWVGWSMPGFGWEMRGAAAAAVFAQTVSAVWVIWYFAAGGSLLRLRFESWRVAWPLVRKILAIGSPPFAMQLAACVLQAIMNNQLYRYGGNSAIAVMGIIYRFVFMILMPLFGLNQGMQPIIGYNYGARKFARVKKALLTSILWACGFAVAGFAIVMLFPSQIIRLFEPDNRELVALGVHAIRISMLMLPAVGFQVIGASYFQAVGKPKASMLLSLSRQVLLLIPAVLILPHFFSLNGVWAALPTADACSSLLTGTCLYLELRHLQRRHEEG